jgi:polar amino acid transport system ATP-binding protein
MDGDDYVLRVEDIHKKFGTNEVLRGVSFNVRKGETIVFIGPSGTGKSTLLRCINQLTVPEKGRVWLRDEDLLFPSEDRDGISELLPFRSSDRD